MKVENSRVWLEIDLGLLKNNLEYISELVAPTKVLAVIKANAYGLGALKIAEKLLKSDIAGFCVANVEEALELKPLGKPVQILGALLDFEIKSAVANNFIIGIIDIDLAIKVSREACTQKKFVRCHLKIDSGMGRLGMISNTPMKDFLKILALPNLVFEGVYSHFANSDQSEYDFTIWQINTFISILDRLKKAGPKFEKVHLANSDGIINYLEIVKNVPFNYVRMGINLYGYPDHKNKSGAIKPIVTLKSRLVSIKKLPSNHSIGYGSTYMTTTPTLIGIVSAGYADGIPLNLSNKGFVIIKGQLCPIIGRVSMDYLTVSLDSFTREQITNGEGVILIGESENKKISVESWAQMKGTNSYDILCSFGKRVKRYYK